MAERQRRPGYRGTTQPRLPTDLPGTKELANHSNATEQRTCSTIPISGLYARFVNTHQANAASRPAYSSTLRWTSSTATLPTTAGRNQTTKTRFHRRCQKLAGAAARRRRDGNRNAGNQHGNLQDGGLTLAEQLMNNAGRPQAAGNQKEQKWQLNHCSRKETDTGCGSCSS